MSGRKRYKLLACDVLYREVCFCVSRCRNVVDAEFLEQGLHDVGEAKMVARLQEAIDAVDVSRYDAILLAYGLCNNGIRGLRSKLPLVIPRAHDCITLLMGSKERYREYFEENPGTYFRSTGWIERVVSHVDNPESTTSVMGINRSHQEYVEEYGEENAAYLAEILGHGLRNYSKMAFIDTHVDDDPYYKKQTEEEARQNGLEYEEIQGSTDLLLRMVNGEWDSDDFLIVQPGRTIAPSYDDAVIEQA